MSTTNTTALILFIVAVGRIAKGEGFSSRVFIGAMFLAIFLGIIGEANPKLARQFGVLILIGAAFTYGPAIVQQSGIAKQQKAAKKKANK